MKTSIDQIRIVNIFKKAIENGFELDINNTVDENRINAEEFLIAETSAIEEECEVKHGKDQRIDFVDSNGWSFWTQGDIVDFSENWHQSPQTKVFHTTVVDSNAQVIRLFYLVGETDFNR